MNDPRGFMRPDDERLADLMARELTEVSDVPGLRPTDDFADRVMAAVAAEPVPQPAVAFGSAVRAARVGAALAAIGDAWRVAFGGPRPIAARAQAMALVLVVAVVALGSGGMAAVGAARLLGLDGRPAPSTIEPSPSPIPSIAPSPSPAPSVSPSPTPTESIEPTETAEPTETPEATDDHGGGGGGGSGPGGGDDSGSHSGSGSDDSGSSSGSGSGSDDSSSSHSGGSDDSVSDD